ncbi:hypothetical protein O6H91_03G119600 [Diphasiastrum complanatum]|uniref:Uncharacterized protein n=2 Tax=Diphasiastrum complanatum TaxID=34168 RepID=A0ACC2EB02_DIPCM|nr:hypothetical protein O6H91_22G017700 [Diphasiastrum complanatum]KAJ7563664.1 hypothetical protein O6H91_03G119600 [Diphasiastrum complanatum]
MAYAWSPSVLHIAAALLCTFTLLFNYARADCGGFAVSCGSIVITSNGGLRCTCDDGQGRYRRASLDLNAHISNNNGNLVDGGDFAATCQNIRWYQLGTDNQGIAAECVKDDGSLGSTTLYNVERRVANNGGNLAWNNCRRRRSLLRDHVGISPRKVLTV